MEKSLARSRWVQSQSLSRRIGCGGIFGGETAIHGSGEQVSEMLEAGALELVMLNEDVSEVCAFSQRGDLVK